MHSGRHAWKNHYLDDACTGLTDTCETATSWFVIWTRSNCEQIVRDQLLLKQYEVFLPMAERWAVVQTPRMSGERSELNRQMLKKAPLFKGYLFVRRQMDKAAYIDISNTKGVVQILGVRWNSLASIDDEYINSIKLLVDSQLPILPYPYLKPGARVRITRGPLSNAIGSLVRSDSSAGIFVVSVSLLRSSVAVNVDCADLVPA